MPGTASTLETSPIDAHSDDAPHRIRNAGIEWGGDRRGRWLAVSVATRDG
jgi:hypothetical protein